MYSEGKKWTFFLLMVVLLFSILFIVVEIIYENRVSNQTVEKLETRELKELAEQTHSTHDIQKHMQQVEKRQQVIDSRLLELENRLIGLSKDLRNQTLLLLMVKGLSKKEALALIQKNNEAELNKNLPPHEVKAVK